MNYTEYSTFAIPLIPSRKKLFRVGIQTNDKQHSEAELLLSEN